MALQVGAILVGLGSGRSPVGRLLVGPSEKVVTQLRIAEDLGSVDPVPGGTLVFLTRPASQQAAGYQLDVALRQLGDPAGLVIQSNCDHPSSTGLPLAQRMGIPVILLERSIELGAVFSRITRLLEAGTGDLLDRAAALLAEIDDAVARDVAVETSVREAAEEAFGLRIEERDDELLGVPVVVTEPDGRWIQRRATSPSEDLLAQLVSWRLAGAVTRQTIEADRASQLSVLSAAALLDQLVESTDETETRRLARQARDIGLPIDGWHQAVHFDFTNLIGVSDHDPVLAYEQNENLSQVAIQAASRQGGRWSMIVRPSGPILLRTRARPSGPNDTRQLVGHVRHVIDALMQRLPDLNAYCGIGSSHEGIGGISTTITEASSAIQSARLRGSVNEPLLFDAPGIRRLLIEWYSSMTVRDSIGELLSPLDDLDDQKRSEYLKTLRVYLDNNQMLSKSAEQLFVHRNTMAYRIKRILDLLQVSLEEPHQVLALHLACHAESALHPSGRPGGSTG